MRFSLIPSQLYSVSQRKKKNSNKPNRDSKK